MFNTYTTTGSFSRSAVMDQCGAKTQLAAYIQVRTTTACPIKPPAQPVVKSNASPHTSLLAQTCLLLLQSGGTGWGRLDVADRHLVVTMLLTCQKKCCPLLVVPKGLTKGPPGLPPGQQALPRSLAAHLMHPCRPSWWASPSCA